MAAAEAAAAEAAQRLNNSTRVYPSIRGMQLLAAASHVACNVYPKGTKYVFSVDSFDRYDYTHTLINQNIRVFNSIHLITYKAISGQVPVYCTGFLY